MADKNGCIDWDDEVSEQDADDGGGNGFVVLPPGNYTFTVKKKELGKFNGSEKLPPCNQVKIEIIVDGGDKGKAYVYHRFYMHTKMLWKIYAFMESIGVRKKGDAPSSVPWKKVTKDLTGTCHIKIKKIDRGQHAGEDANEVDKWIAPTEDIKPEGDDW